MLLWSTVDGAAPDSSGKVGVFVCFTFEKSCTDECLERTVDEHRMESVLIDSSVICTGVVSSAIAQPSPDVIPVMVWNASPYLNPTARARA